MEIEEEKLKKIINPLLKWYEENARDLPWRRKIDPYSIWLSEIMLQQTRIEAVIKYYERFIKEVPTISDLANIEEEKLLKLWEGLGYYNRAKNLKKAAQKIMKDYQGKMPKNYNELLTLPGIGEYTAGAIASIAYQEKVPAVDGNVLRVISRILAKNENILLSSTKKEITQRLKNIIPEKAGNFNEALMELGERICIPNGTPNCKICPLKKICLAKQQNLTEKIPIREKQRKRKIEKKTVFLILCEQKVAIKKRDEKGLLAGMYEFPNAEGQMKIQEVKEKWKTLDIKEVKKLPKNKHVFSHIEWDMIGYKIKVNKRENSSFLWVTLKELEESYALPTAFLKYAKYLKEE